MNDSYRADLVDKLASIQGLVLLAFVPQSSQATNLALLAARFGPRLTILRLDVDSHRFWAERLGVSELPTWMLFREGRRLASLEGFVPVEALAVRVKELLGNEDMTDIRAPRS